MIIERQPLPGAKIPQEKLAEDLGISRTPLVNALKLLEQDKLVQSIPRRGFFVRHFNKREMISIFGLREVLEGLAARRAAENISAKQIEQLKGFFKQFNGARKITDIRAYAKEDRLFHTFLLDVGAKEFLKSILETYNLHQLQLPVALRGRTDPVAGRHPSRPPGGYRRHLPQGC